MVGDGHGACALQSQPGIVEILGRWLQRLIHVGVVVRIVRLGWEGGFQNDCSPPGAAHRAAQRMEKSAVLVWLPLLNFLQLVGSFQWFTPFQSSSSVTHW